MELNGAAVTVEQLRSLALTNYGHFTSMLAEDGRVRGFSLHMQRLARDCRQLFDADLDTDRVRLFIRDTLRDVREPIVVRVTVYDPAIDLGTIGGDADPHTLVTTRPAPSGKPSAVRLQAASYRREIPAVKHTGLLGALKRRRDAQREGYDDTLFLNPDGSMSEVATSNIGFIRGGQVVWPRAEVLPGVTMTLINQALDEPVARETLTLADVPGMDAAFVTNAVSGVRAVASIDDTELPSGSKDVERLRELYLDIPAERV